MLTRVTDNVFSLLIVDFLHSGTAWEFNNHGLKNYIAENLLECSLDQEDFAAHTEQLQRQIEGNADKGLGTLIKPKISASVDQACCTATTPEDYPLARSGPWITSTIGTCRRIASSTPLRSCNVDRAKLRLNLAK
jgi:hypothetical protein